MREIGRYDAGEDGPTLVLVGGVHGNEPAGIATIVRVVEGLAGKRIRGRVIGLRGNLRALAAKRRFIDRDLNRTWTSASVADALAERSDDAEAREMRELHALVADHLQRPGILVDLHSSSGPGAPFVVGASVPGNREALFSTRVPVVLGLEERVPGSFAGYWVRRGHIGMGIEGGREGEPSTSALQVAAVWELMLAQGLVDEAPDLDIHTTALQSASEGAPPSVEVIHHHIVPPDTAFVMDPGWRSFAPVHKGQHLAQGPDGPVLSPHDGVMLLPRYQDEGADGFFIARVLPTRA